EVVTLQQALVELGYLNGATDGNFGTATETAVKNFQTANGLDSDGIAGRLTLERLYQLSSVTPMPEVTVGPDDILDLPG
ncbi:MAG TPA: peptidoglycan-binding protein, partial [Candidatus Ventricola intestinavium]|nr:peptidoglycan-binding protein [Candidatus Ventricola intestinavium]